MGFERESDMIVPLRKSLPGLLVPEGPYAVACEVPDGARVVDIMYASMPSSSELNIADAERFAGRLSRLSVAQTMVLALIWREGRVSLSRLGAMTYMRSEKLEADYLRPFEGSGLIERDRRSWVVGSWGGAGPAQLVAVEAKLTDWREALCQADDNRTRADLSYIALPQIDARRNCAELMRSARERGVGVIELHPHGDAEIVVKARRAPASVCKQKWQLSVRLLADVLRPDGRWVLVRGTARV
jgi:hypothetical protein